MSSTVTFAEIALGGFLGGVILSLVATFIHDALGLD